MAHKKGIYENYIKRPQDLILSITALFMLWPLYVVIAVILKVKLGKPLLFKQERAGLNKKIFYMYKFRTMTDSRDETGRLLPDSKRITKFGEFLRASSLDELPELINIIKGDMSIVGPRPYLVQYLPLYNEHQKRRHEVRPGLTGYAQVNGRNNLSWEEKFDLDVEYVDNVSFKNDWLTIFKTIHVVLKKDGINSHGNVTSEEFKGSGV